MTLLEFIKKIYFQKSVIKKNLLLILIVNFIGFIFILYNHSSSKFSDEEKIIYSNVPINITKDIYQNLPFRDLVGDGLSIDIEKDGLGFQVWNYIFSSPNQKISDKTIGLFNELLANGLKNQKNFILKSKEINNNDNCLLQNILQYEVLNRNKKAYYYEPLVNNKIQEILSIIIQSNIFAIIFIFILRIQKFKKF